jgi:hypothetical protein
MRRAWTYVEWPARRKICYRTSEEELIYCLWTARNNETCGSLAANSSGVKLSYSDHPTVVGFRAIASRLPEINTLASHSSGSIAVRKGQEHG